MLDEYTFIYPEFTEKIAVTRDLKTLIANPR
jgi:hypothetical protein